MPGSYPDSSPSLSGGANSPGASYHDADRSSPDSWRYKNGALYAKKLSKEFAATPPITPTNVVDAERGIHISPSARYTQQLPYRIASDINGHRTTGLEHAQQSHTRESAISLSYSPPTPEITPPATLLVPHQHNLSRGSVSTRAESFRTASEDRISEREDAGGPGSHVNEGYNRFTPPLLPEGSPRLSMQKQRGVTNVPDAQVIQAHQMLIIGDSMEHKEPQMSREEWAPLLMRNVTVRRRRLPRPTDAETSPITSDLGSLLPPEIDCPADYPAPLTRNYPLQVQQPISAPRPYIPGPSAALGASANNRSLSDGHMGRGLPSSPYSRASHHRKTSEPNRSSMVSRASGPYVEAIIVASPPSKPRTLRHVSKTMSLRSSSGSLASTSPNPAVSPVDSDTTLRSRRQSARSSLGTDQTYRRPSTNSTAPSEVSQMHLLHHGQDRSALRYQAAKPALRHSQNQIDMQNQALDRQRASPLDAATVATSAPRDSPNEPRLVTASAKHIVSFDPVPKFVFKAATPINELDRVHEGDAPISIVAQHSIEATPLLAPSERSPAISVSAGRFEGKRRRVSAPDQRISMESENRRISMSSQRRPSISSTPVSITGEPFPRPGMERLLTNPDDISVRQSFDRSSVATYEYGRPSIDRLTIRTEDTGLARHTTPFSIVSEFGDGLELSEATAVSIYPHTNNSLLIVQQGARYIQSTGPIRLGPTAGSRVDGSVLRIEPSTPPLQVIKDPINVDSPLKNPRRPPEPPAIRITAATPATELAICPIEDFIGAGDPRPLVRRPTLTEKARRYSESVLQPLIIRTNSVRRSVVGSKYQQRHVSLSSAMPRRDKSGNLHPLWQPKRFWDDESGLDSDSDPGNQPDNAHRDSEPGDEDDDRLPPGGDTTELGEPRGIARIYDSLKHKRQNGAFLLGNSLGIERSGTNRRKPQIILPTELSRIASGRIVRRMESAGTLRSAISSVNSTSSRPRQGKSSTKAKEGSVLKRSGSRRKSWRGLGLHVEWLGVAGLQEHRREKKREKKREEIRKSIGRTWTVENALLTD